MILDAAEETQAYVPNSCLKLQICKILDALPNIVTLEMWTLGATEKSPEVER